MPQPPYFLKDSLLSRPAVVSFIFPFVSEPPLEPSRRRYSFSTEQQNNKLEKNPTEKQNNI